jgi:hypothetical protein
VNPHAQPDCEVCGEALGGGRDSGPWVCFQSLWIIPAGNGKPTSVERANGDPFVGCHVHCLRMLVQGEMAPPAQNASVPPAKAKARKKK